MKSLSKIVSIALGLGAAAIAAPAIADDEPTELARSSQWNVDFAPNKCRLAAFFGEGEERHLLFFEQFYPSQRAGLTVAGPAFERFRSLRETMLSFSEEQEPVSTEPFAGDIPTVGPAIIYSNIGFDPEEGETEDESESAPTTLPQLDPGLGNAIEFVSLRQRSREVRLATGPLGEAFEVLNTCTRDMVREWGLDVEQHMTATRMPEWLNEQEVAMRIARNYPSAALNRGEQAILRMRVIVDTEGRVEQCLIDEATTTEALVSPACRQMERAEFTPALDAEGNPFRSFYATVIVYRING